MADTLAIAAMIRTLTAARGSDKSLCPSEVAQALLPGDANWQRLLPAIRAEAARLAQAGEIAVLRKGKPVDPTQPIKGVVRLRAV